MPINEGLMTSARADWETPPDLFAFLNALYPYTLDVAASHDNALCEWYYTQHSLTLPWTGNVWCNPPYGRAIGAWVEKACQEFVNYEHCTLLLPARTDTQWFARLYDQRERSYVQIELITGRLKFCLHGVPQGPAPFPSMLVHLTPKMRGWNVSLLDARSIATP